MIKFEIGYINGRNIAIFVEHGELPFKMPLLWFSDWGDFVQFREMIEGFYQDGKIPEVILRAFGDGEEKVC